MLDGENKLITHAVRGRASAFGSLYDYYQPKIYRFVLIKVGQREEAEDLTHEVFLNAWQNINRYKDLGFPFGAWLYQIARNKVIDHYRTRKSTVNLENVDPNSISVTAAEWNPDSKLEIERLMAAVRQLKPDYQDVIIMRFVEDLPIKETADAVGKTEGAVKLIQHRAIKELKNIVGQDLRES